MQRPQPMVAAMVAICLLAPLVRAEDAESLHAFDFAVPAQLEALTESSGQSAQYPHHAAAGIGGQPGYLAVLNGGTQNDGLYLLGETLDLRQQSVTVSAYFRADGSNGKGTARIFLGLADSPAVNLVSGDAKIGVRIYKSGSPANANSPWVLQLINGVATRDLGAPFALIDGHWYRVDLTLSLAEDGRQVTFVCELREYDESGEQPLHLHRRGSGVTQDLGSYNLRQMHAAFLGQNQNGGATAIDNLSIRSIQRPGSTATQAALAEVQVPPTPLTDLRAPQRTIFGACGHFMHTPLFYRDGEKSPYWQLEYTLPHLVRANLGWAREPIYQPWFDDESNPRAMENRQTVERYLESYQRHGVRVILVPLAVGPENKKHAKFQDDYFRWIAGLCARYSCVEVVEMHNEPNLKFFWSGTAEDYVTVYRNGARIIREQAPAVTIAVGSISSLWWEPGIEWLTRILDAGALEWADAVAVHPYNKRFPPEADPHWTGGSPNDPDHLRRAIHAFNELVQSKAPAGKVPSLYFTELGYSSGVEGMAALGDEQLQADYLSRLMLIYFAVRLDNVPLRAVTWYDFKNDGRSDHAESNFGLIAYDTSRLKPAYEAYRRVAGFFDDPDRFTTEPVDIAFSNWPEVIQHHAWRRDDGALIIPVWRMEQRQSRDIDFITELRIVIPDGARPRDVVWHSLSEQSPRSIGWTMTDQTLRVPVHVTRRAAWLEIIPNSSRNGG